MTMFKRAAMAAVLPLALLATAALAESDYGTAEDAKTMLERAVAVLKQDEGQALQMFNQSEGSFKDRDLYVFCGGPDGNYTAHGGNPKLVGQSLKSVKDKTGKPLGEEIYQAAQEGQVAEVSYMWPRPGEQEPMPKTSYVTKAGAQVCGVGYYRQQ